MKQSPQIPAQVPEHLERLGRFWSFPRKKLAAEISAHLQAFNLEAKALHEQFVSLQALASQQTLDLARLDEQSTSRQAQITALDGQLLSSTQQLAELNQRHVETQLRGKELLEQRDQARTLATQLRARLVDAAQRTGALETLVSEQTSELESKSQSIALLHETADQLVSSQAGLQQDLQQMTNQHLTLREKFELVQRVLAVTAPANSGLDNFARLIREDYRQFAASESSLADEAGALLELQAIHQEMELIVDFPGARGKNLLAIAGGFSSGKSRFINSFIRGGEVSLAVGMNPVTVVPSYVICAQKPRIRGYGVNGGSIELSEKLYASLSHEYLETFGFDLRSIMPFVSVQVPMQEDLFEHLCLIDTPGYNPGGGQTAAGDYSVAQSFAGQAAAMIWVIGLDPAGTITQSDLDFIEKTNLQGQSLYILLNKSDTKSTQAIEAVMDEVETRLLSYGFEFSGICAYSSRKQEVHSWRGQTLEEFLRQHNHRHDVQGELERKVDQVFDRYKQAITTDLDRKQSRRKHLDRFKLEAMQAGGTDLYRAVNDLCLPIESDLGTKDLKVLESECEKLRQMFKDALKVTLNEVLSDGSPKHRDEKVAG